MSYEFIKIEKYFVFHLLICEFFFDANADEQKTNEKYESEFDECSILLTDNNMKINQFIISGGRRLLFTMVAM